MQMRSGFCRAIGWRRGRGGAGYVKQRAGGAHGVGAAGRGGHAGGAWPTCKSRRLGGAWPVCKSARGRFPPPARQSAPRRFKRRRACAERRKRDLVCYTTALRSPRPAPPGAPLPAAPPAPPGRPRLRYERGPAAQRFPGEHVVPARGARSPGTPPPRCSHPSPRAGPGLAASPPPVTPAGGPCPAAAPMRVGRALSAQLSPRGGMGGGGSGDPRVTPWLGGEGEGAAAALPRLAALWGAREGSPP